MSVEITNEQLYQELRKTQRRVIAACAMVLAGVGGSIWFIAWEASIPALFAAILLLFIAEYLQHGRFRSIVGRWVGNPPKTEPELRDELGEPYEPANHYSFSGGLHDLVFRDREGNQ